MQTTDGWSVRRLQRSELEDYKRLRDRSLADFPDAFSSDASEALSRDAASYRNRLGEDRADGGHFLLGAFDGVGRLLGAVGCERDERLKVRHIGHLTGMMVRADCAAQGIGRALLDAAIETARRARGLDLLTLSVTAGNARAVRLYEQAGFVRHGSLANAIKVDGRSLTKDAMSLTL